MCSCSRFYLPNIVGISSIRDGESPVVLFAPATLFYTLQRLTVSAHRCFEKAQFNRIKVRRC